jgi:hypothetical protein
MVDVGLADALNRHGVQHEKADFDDGAVLPENRDVLEKDDLSFALAPVSSSNCAFVTGVPSTTRPCVR